jgi:hypothetical protein
MTISYGASLGLIFGSCALGLGWGFFNWLTVKKVNLVSSSEDQGGLNTRMQDEESKDSVAAILDIGSKIKAGAKAFLAEEYKFCLYMLCAMAVIVFFAVDS